MHKARMVGFTAGTALLIAGMAYVGDVHTKALEGVWGVLRALRPAPAEGGGQVTRQDHPEAPGQPPACQAAPGVGPETNAMARRIRAGMTRQSVEGILGPPVMTRTAPRDDGGEVRTAIWMHGNDLITVRFGNGEVLSLLATPLRDLPPLKRPAPDDAPPEGETSPAPPAPPQVKPEAIDSLTDLLRDIAEQKRRRDEAVRGLLNQSSAGK